MSQNRKVNIENAKNLYKTVWGKLSENHYNSATPLNAIVKKSYTFTGKKLEVPVPTKMIGGVGAGKLPEANYFDPEMMVITRKKVYARAKIEREAIVAADDKGAFVRQTKNTVEKTVERYANNTERILHGDGTGVLGVVDTFTAGTVPGTRDEITIAAANFIEANFEENDYLNFGSSTALYLLEDVEVSAAGVGTLYVTLLQGSAATITNGTAIYMQNSKDAEPMGLKGVVLNPTSAQKLYGIDVSRHWESSVIDANGAPVSTKLLSQLSLAIHKKSGKSPTHVLCNYKRFSDFMEITEDQKRYSVVESRYAKEVKLSFKSIELMTIDGPIPVILDRFLPDDLIYMINANYIEIMHAPQFGWFDTDGTVFLRELDEDSYEARYGGYWECVIHPPFQGAITGLGDLPSA